jgi:hypothetical protein
VHNLAPGRKLLQNRGGSCAGRSVFRRFDREAQRHGL